MKLLFTAIMAFGRLNELLNFGLKTQKSYPGGRIELLRLSSRFLGDGSSEIAQLLLALERMNKLQGDIRAMFEKGKYRLPKCRSLLGN